MSYIYYDDLFTSTQQGSLSSTNNELVLTSGGAFTADYNVYAVGYNQSEVTVTSPTSASVVKPIAPYTLTINKYDNGVDLSDATTLSVSVSSTAAISCAILLNAYGVTRPLLAVPFNIVYGTTTLSLDLSAATTDFSDDELRRLRLLGYIS